MRNSVGSRIKTRRLELGLTLEEVAKAIGVGKPTVQKYETGAIKNIGSAKLNELANILQTSPEYLLDFKPQAQREKFEDYIKQRYQNSTLLIEIIDIWDFLNNEGKQEAVKRVKELTEIIRYRDEDFIESLTYEKGNEV